MLYTNEIKANIQIYFALEKLCIVDTPDVVRVIKEMLQYIGQGEGETK
jgi:hypothetical protein